MPSNSIPVFFTPDTDDADFIIGKNSVGSSANLPVPIPDELASEVDEFDNTAPLRNVEFWHSGSAAFYNYTGTQRLLLSSTGNLTAAGNITTPGIGTFTTQVVSNLGTFASLSAPYKMFDIPHPSAGKEDKRLLHACLEGPEIAVYTRGKTSSSIIPLPDYWKDLVDEDSITIQLTATNSDQSLFVHHRYGFEICIWGNNNMPYYFLVMAERKDVPQLQVEIPI